MGDIIILPITILEILCLLNERFAPGASLQEMVAIHREFQVFHQKYSLKQSYRLLHIVPKDFRERQLWYRYLDLLKTYPSDIDGMSGHDRIIKARQENLDGSTPMPMYTTTHPAGDESRVMVTRGRPFHYDNEDYIIISTPIRSATASAAAPPEAGPKRAARRKRAA